MVAFLTDLPSRPLNVADTKGARPLALFLGNVPSALEVAVLEYRTQPTVANLRAIWRSRLAGRATPLLVVVLHERSAALCGPTGDPPPAFASLQAERVERICRAALTEPDRNAALRFLASVIPDADAPLPGLRNEGLFATHELQQAPSQKKDVWAKAQAQGEPLLNLRGEKLLQQLGYTIEATTGQVSILRGGDQRRAIAVFLDRNESPDLPSSRFAQLSPLSYALAKADQENLDWVIVSAGPALRLHPVGTGVGTGRRSRTETFAEIHLDLLGPGNAAYLWLIYSADALRKEGLVAELLSDSERYAADLGTRLRERVYGEVIPELAMAILSARGLRRPSAEDLAETYQMTLVYLFRLLFLAYAEDKDLLPFKHNPLYRDRSLKHKAQELAKLRAAKTPFAADSILWEEIDRLFRAIDKGNASWGVPAYNGGLFSREEAVSPLGAKLASISLSDEALGPVLTSLLVEGSEGGSERWGPVDFRSLGVREFGTIYEGLLENELAVAERDLTVKTKDRLQQYAPAVARDKIIVAKGGAYLYNTSGARKSTGSYFTKHFAVEYLLDHSLEPALKEHCERLDTLTEAEAAKAFFDFRVTDLAMGSGHFLVAAVDRIERRLSNYLYVRQLPSVQEDLGRLREAANRALGDVAGSITIEETQLLRRQVARRCLYGVDLNPMAVSLARLAIWIHTFVPGLPLSFLDHNLTRGNSLIGVGTLEEANTWMRDRFGLFALKPEELQPAADALARLASLSDANAAEIAQARAAIQAGKRAAAPVEAFFDIICAARLDKACGEAIHQDADRWMKKLSALPGSPIHIRAREILAEVPPFHFPVAFPEVFLRPLPGFDVIVGNPPWEKVRVEEHEFWARHVPGLRALNKEGRDRLLEKLRRERPDLVTVWQRERAESERMRAALRFLPGMDTGHPDLFRAFTFRFTQLAVARGGRIGVVLPGDAFKIAGAAEIREGLAASCSDLAAQMLTNKAHWVFDDVDSRKLISLLTATVGHNSSEAIFHIPPEFHDAASWDSRDPNENVEVPISALRSYSASLVVPLLPNKNSFKLIETFMKSPTLALHPTLRVRRVYADFETSKHDKRYWHSDRAKSDWPVYAGESFDLWQPDTGRYYAFTDADVIQEASQLKWTRAPRGSPYAELSKSWRLRPQNHPIHFPRIAFRDVTNRTNTRTLVTALIPPGVVTVQTAPWVLWLDPEHPIAEEAYLVGIMSSLPLDWWCRRFIEQHADQEAFNCLRIPDPRTLPKLSGRAIALAGRLASVDRRFCRWAEAIGVPDGPLDAAEKNALISELDAIVAHLYGLTERQLYTIFETFHEGWDFEDRLRETLKHFQAWNNRS